jgi:hypothetical protein
MREFSYVPTYILYLLGFNLSLFAVSRQDMIYSRSTWLSWHMTLFSLCVTVGDYQYLL